MFRSLFRDTQDKVADRIDRHADRYRNAGDYANEHEARAAADLARNAASVDEARQIERDFYGRYRGSRGRDDS
jgi:hypothetical protein